MNSPPTEEMRRPGQDAALEDQTPPRSSTCDQVYVVAVWRALARRVIDELAGGGEDFTSEDVHAQIGWPPGRKQIGAALSVAVRQGVIVSTGARVTDDGRLIRVFRGAR